MTPMLPRLFFVHFATTTAIVSAPGGPPVGFLCGFRSTTDPTVAYIHFVGVDPDVRGEGVGRMMYEWFFQRVGLARVHDRAVRHVTAQHGLAGVPRCDGVR